MASEIERDAVAILRLLYTWSEQEDDPKTGRYDLSTDEVLDAINLPLERVNDAVSFLKDRGFLGSIVTQGGLQRISPTTEGRLEFQKISAEQQPVPNGNYDIFLSHSGQDDALTKDVKKLLEHNGLSVFSTPTSIPSGKWEPQIERALQDATDCWVLLTHNALTRSVWVHNELGYYYGFRHGQGGGELGEHSHFVFPTGTPLPGLYSQLMGTPTDDIGNPEVVAGIITNSLGITLDLPPSWQSRTYSTVPTGEHRDQEQFELESQEALHTGFASEMEPLGHWQVIIRPSTFQKERVSDFSSLYRLVQQSQARMPRCDYPSATGEAFSKTGADWTGEDFTDNTPEAWRLYQSGQFVGRSVFWHDLDIESISREELFDVSEAVCFLTCVFSFAASLAQTLAGDDHMVIEITANNIGGRRLAARTRLLSGGNSMTDTQV